MNRMILFLGIHSMLIYLCIKIDVEPKKININCFKVNSKSQKSPYDCSLGF